MKDLFEQILKYLPHYLTEFGTALSGPKSFIATKVSSEGDAFGESLLFLGTSLALVLLLNAPLLPAEKEFSRVAIPYFAYYLLTLPLAAMVIRAAWWIVGGRAPARLFFITYAYYAGVAIVLLSAIDLVCSGLFKTFDPQLYQEVSEPAQKSQTVQDWIQSGLLHRYNQSYATFSAAIIDGLGYFALFIWGLIGWGAYRQLNGLSKLRSFAAFMISWVLSIPVVAVSRFIDAIEG
jgi:hypothetical protein